MISDKMQNAINEQINYELFSSYLYLSMSSYLESVDLPGFANWHKIQSQEELAHVDIFFNHLNERDGRVLLSAIEGPQTEWESPLACFEDAYHHEQQVSQRINKLMELAHEEKDYASASFLKWFVEEQVEEEASVKAIVQELKMVGEQGQGLYMMNKELGQRQFVRPVPGA